MSTFERMQQDAAETMSFLVDVPGLFRSISPDRDHAPCPFGGERYQWMRNLAAAQALAGPLRSWAAAVVFADGAGLHAAQTEWAAFKAELAAA